MDSILELCKRAKRSSLILKKQIAAKRTAVLFDLVDVLISDQELILNANELDRKEATTLNITEAMLERLTLTSERIAAMAQGVRDVAALADVVGEIFDSQVLPNGLRVHKQRVPLGVLAVIYESRPNVTIDVAALAIKSGNAVILRGGKETLRTNRVLVDCVHKALRKNDIPLESVQFVDDPERGLVLELLKMVDYVDMLIPRGGAALHRFCRENSLIPVITGGIGICHLFVDESADLEKTIEVITNAKIQRPTVCNALDTVLIHENIVAAFLPILLERMRRENVMVHLPWDSMEKYELEPDAMLVPIAAGDYDREWLSLNLGVQIVSGLDSAIDFISEHSTAHSDGILTESTENAGKFLNGVDSAVVYVNASTRFTDGGELGLGAEVAVSTQRLHARGPLALQALTTYKWVVAGDYHTRG